MLNREPEITSLTFDPNKFIFDCDGSVVCVTATDPDCDPIEIAWSTLSATPVSPTPVSRDLDNCEVTECARIQPPFRDAYEFQVVAYDLLISGSAMMRIEDWLAAHGYPHDSHAALSFPIYQSEECAGQGGGGNGGEQPACCTLTQGYWKTHHKYAPTPSQNIPWPDPVDEDDLLCGQSLLDTLQAVPAGGEAYLILAHQYIAAELNVAAGATTPVAVDDALAAAQSLLTACSIDPWDRPFALALADVLDDYNNGLIGPGHCS